ncbi:hypothetical protein OIU84_005476 [Salix udensis]|uniref:Uncharacterized protein n=1 Tax=Salix udensis TaxID=889485 RepID=A0AAD6JWB1_9ROSI|nr:hypothetical protein OIU84_005476 [Salix udensis]
MHSCFTFAGDEDFLKNDIRVKSDLDAHGALGDAGWYGIRSILWAVDYELPKTVTALPGDCFKRSRGYSVLRCFSAMGRWESGNFPLLFSGSFDNGYYCHWNSRDFACQ